MEENILICTMGLPYSGKSTWARGSGYPIVSPDAIRLSLYGQRYWPDGERMVWAIADLMVRSLFEAGHSRVVLDATNYHRKRRDEWQSDSWRTAFKFIRTNKQECVRRAEEAGDEDILPVIKRMASGWEPLHPDEEQWRE